MSIQEAQARIKARVWQSLAQSDLELKSLPQPEIEKLVEMVTNAALLEIDAELEQSLAVDTAAGVSPKTTSPLDDEEQVLWEGRPLLSINTRYIITDERLRIVEGLLGKTREDVELVRIQDIDQSQSVGERLMNVGDIIVHSHDRTNPTIHLNNIKNPQEVHEVLRRAVLNARQKHRLSYREEM